jgi:Carboxylesterase family
VKTTAPTIAGLLRGQEEAGVVVFRGVPYATCERFGPPMPVACWAGERAATVDAPIAPQLPSRLEPVMGAPEYHDQSSAVAERGCGCTGSTMPLPLQLSVQPTASNCRFCSAPTLTGPRRRCWPAPILATSPCWVTKRVRRGSRSFEPAPRDPPGPSSHPTRQPSVALAGSYTTPVTRLPATTDSSTVRIASALCFQENSALRACALAPS